MLNSERSAEILRKHFAEVTTEQFLENLKKSCPEVLDDSLKQSEESNLSKTVKQNFIASEVGSINDE